MSLNNTISEYGLVAKLFHWISFIILIIQIPLGFYLVKLDFSDTRITLEEYHVIFGIIIFYLTILRLFYKIISKSPKLHNSSFIGQNLIAKLNHFALYLSLLAITTSGILKKLFNGETLNFFLFKLKFKTNFDLADKFYDLHIISNYTLIVLISLHIFAVIFHKVFLKENILKRMT